MSDYDSAAARLMSAIQYMTPEEVSELAEQAERAVAWRMALQQVEAIARQPHDRFLDDDHVVYQHLLDFTLAIGAPSDIASRLWTSFFNDPGRTRKEREAIRYVPIRVGDIRRVRHTRAVSLTADSQMNQLLNVWVDYYL